MINFYSTSTSKMVQIDNFEEGCWVNVISPTVDEIKYLTKELNLDSGFVSATLDEEESSRIEIEDDQTLIIIDTPFATKEENDTLVYTTMPIGIIITKKFLVTVCLNETTALTDIANGFVKNIQTEHKTRFLLTILLRIAQSFLVRLKHINKMSSQIESELHKSMKNKELIQLLGLEKSLVYFSTSLKANELTLDKIYKGRGIKLYEEDQELLEDVLIEFKQAIEMSNIYSSILSGTMDAFASIISNNLNIVMKVLTIVTTLMAVPTMIFSFYGMNMQDLDSYYTFTWLPLVLSAVLVSIAGIILWKKKF